MSDRNRTHNFLRAIPAAQPSEPAVPAEFSEPAIENGSLTVTREAFTLEFVFLKGERLALPYTSLLSSELDPSRVLTVEFHTHTITMTGWNLVPIHEAIASRSAASIHALTERHRPKDQGIPVVTQIKMTKRDRES